MKKIIKQILCVHDFATIKDGEVGYLNMDFEIKICIKCNKLKVDLH